MATRWMMPWTGGGLAERSADPFFALHREMNRLFDDMMRGYGMPAMSMQGGMSSPRVDVSETDKEIKICAELPGVSEKDVEVTLDDDVLTIRGEKKAESESTKQDYHMMERSYGSFARSIRLPGAVKPETVQASFENGVLTVTAPKANPQQTSRRIEVKGSQQQGGKTGRVSADVQRAAAGDKPGSVASSYPTADQMAQPAGQADDIDSTGLA